MLLVICDVQLEDAVDDVDDLAVVDDMLVGVVPHAHFNERLQNEVDQLHCLSIDVI